MPRAGEINEYAPHQLRGHGEEVRAVLPPNAAGIDPATNQPSTETFVDVWRIDEGISPLPDPDPPLTEQEQEGKEVFARACSHCHGGPGQSTTQPPVVRYHDIATQCPRPVDTVTPARFAFAPCPPRLARNARTYEITLANGSRIRRTSSDPGRALLTGVVGGPAPLDDWNKLDVNGLRGISNTAPYFHNNSAATLEDVVDHYIEFFKRVRANAPPGVAPPVASTDGVNFDRQPTPEERAALLAYLRKL